MRSIGIGVRPIQLLLILALGLLPVLPSVASATIRKCNNVPGSSRPFVGGVPLLVVDGVTVGDLPDTGKPLSYPTPTGDKVIPAEQIFEIRIICVEHEVAGELVVKQAIAVRTRDGAKAMLRGYLAELVELQEGHRRKYGSYASLLANLEFYHTREPVPIVLTVMEGGWSASGTWGGNTCSIAVGAAVTEGARSGELECVEVPIRSLPASVQIRNPGGG